MGLASQSTSLPLLGTVQFAATVAVPSGGTVGSVEFQESPAGAGAWRTFDTETTPSGQDSASGDNRYTGTLDSTTLADGNYDIRAVALDGSGTPIAHSAPVQDQTVANNAVVNNNGDYIALIDPGAEVNGTVTVVAEPSLNFGVTPDTVTVQYCKVSDNCSQSGDWQKLTDATPQYASPGNPVTDNSGSGGGATIYEAQWDTSRLPNGTYDLHVSGSDSGGDPFTGGEVSGVVVDNAQPTVSLDSPSVLSGTVTLTAHAGDPVTAVSSVKFEAAPAGTQAWQTLGASVTPGDRTDDPQSPTAYGFDLNTVQLVDGRYDLRAIATDVAGNSATSAVVDGVNVSNPTSATFAGLNVTNFDVPATNVKLIGERPGPQHETWAVGITDAPPPASLAGQYKAEGHKQVVLLEYTDSTGWQIAGVLEDGANGPFPLTPDATTRVVGAMAPNGDAWLAICQQAGGQCPWKLFHRAPGGLFDYKAADTANLTGAGLLRGQFSIQLGDTGPADSQSDSGVYGAIFSASNTGSQQSVWTDAGPRTVAAQTQFAELNGDTWQAPTPGSPTEGTLPPGYTFPIGVRGVELIAGAVTGPEMGWAELQVATADPISQVSLTSLILAKFDANGWKLESPIGVDALDSTGPFSLSSTESAANALAAVSPAQGSGADVTPTGIAADASGGFLSAQVAPFDRGASGTIVAQFNADGQIVNSWCGTLAWPSFDCAGSLGTTSAIVPQSVAGSGTAQQAIALDPSKATLDVFTAGSWHTTPAPGFGLGSTAVFAGSTDGWIAGANTMGLVSSTPPASPLEPWPEANRDPLLSVALPPGNSTTDTAGALAVGLDGTSLEYESGSGWQIAPTPQQTHNLMLTGVAFSGSATAVGVGQGGTILDWDGSQWRADSQSGQLTHQTLNAVAFAGDGEGWAVGAYGTLLHYDAGKWAAEAIDSADSGADVTSVAVAGSAVYAVAGGNLIERSADGSWERVPGSEFATTPAPGTLDLVSGLSDGGMAVAGRGLLMTRNASGGQFQEAPQTFNGIPVALSAFRDLSGTVRVFVSVAPAVQVSASSGITNGTGGFPAGDGDLLLETASGWKDLSEDTPANTAFAPAGEGAVHQDAVLAMASSPDGDHAWAVGGYAGTPAADGVGIDEPLPIRPTDWYTSSIWRYDVGGSVAAQSTTQATVDLPAIAGTVNFAYLSSALCAYQCSGAQDPQPFINLQGAAAEIASYAQQPGGPAFTMFGGNAVGPINRGAGDGVDLAELPRLLSPLAGHPVYAAYGPLDGVAGQSDPAGPWAQGFSDAPAPFGAGQAPSGITPQGSGDPTGSVNKYYAFDVSQNSGTLRVIVLDNSQGSLEASAPGQTQWLDNELTAAQSESVPVVVFASEPLDSFDLGAASDADAVAADLAGAGVLAVFTTAGGTTPDGTSSTQTDQVTQIPANAAAGAPQIPEYEGATMTYQQPKNNGVIWYEVSVNTQTGSVSVQGVPVIGSLALEPVDGLTVNRSSTLQFNAVGRRQPSTIAQAPDTHQQIGYPQYVDIPGSSCSACITPSYTFTSSDPTIGTFVAASSLGSSYPKLTADGHVIPSTKSGLFCGFNAGTTTVTVSVGLLSASENVTVNPGGYGPPCGTTTGTSSLNIIRSAGATVYQSAGSPQGSAPLQPQASATPVNKLPIHVPPAPAHSATVHAPTHHQPAVPAKVPPSPQQPQPQPFIAPASSISSVGAAVVPPIPPPLTPVPPGGATAPAQSTAKREEKAKKEASQSAYVTRPAGESADGWFYPAVGLMTVASLLLIAGGVRPGARRAPAYAELRVTRPQSRRRVP